MTARLRACAWANRRSIGRSAGAPGPRWRRVSVWSSSCLEAPLWSLEEVDRAIVGPGFLLFSGALGWDCALSLSLSLSLRRLWWP